MQSPLPFDPDVVYSRDPEPVATPVLNYDVAALQMRVDTLSHHVETLEHDRDKATEEMRRLKREINAVLCRVDWLEGRAR